MNLVFAFFRLIRIGNLLLIALSMNLFYYLVLIPVHTDKLHTSLVPFTRFEFILLILSVVLIAAAGNIINDYYDFEADRNYKSNKPLPLGFFSLNQAMYIHIIFAVTGIGIGYYVSWAAGYWQMGYVYIICSLLLYLYSSFMKKIPLVGNVVVSALTAFIFVLFLLYESVFLRTITFEQGAYAFAIITWQVKFYGGFAFLTNLARELVKTLEDREGDAAGNIPTVAVRFGEPAAKSAAMLVLLLLLAGLGYFMNSFLEARAVKEFSYLLFAVVLPLLASVILLLLAKERSMYHKISGLLKAVMLAGILSIPAFYWFQKLSS